MDVPVTEFRGHLRAWLERVRDGEEVVITDRGLPVARVIAIGATPLLERLMAEGVISPARRPKRPVTGRRRIQARGSVSDIVSQQRR